MGNWFKDEMVEGRAHAEDLIRFAAAEFGQVLDQRIEKLKTETGDLITEKLAEVRREMSETADMQKRSAIRTMTIAVFSAVAVGVVSIGYRQLATGNLDPYFMFRSVVLAIGVGHGMWLAARALSNFVHASKLKKDAAFYASQYLGVFRIRGVAGHLVLLGLVACAWVYLNFFLEI